MRFGSRKVTVDGSTTPFDAFFGPDDSSVGTIHKKDMAVGTPVTPMVTKKLSPRLPYTRVTFLDMPKDRLIRKPYIPSSNKIKIKPATRKLPLSPQFKLPLEFDNMRNVVDSFNNVYNRSELRSPPRDIVDRVEIEHQNRPFS